MARKGNARFRTFCIMNRRLNVRGEVKAEEAGAGSRVHYNPKPSDLPMVRLKRG